MQVYREYTDQMGCTALSVFQQERGLRDINKQILSSVSFGL